MSGLSAVGQASPAGKQDSLVLMDDSASNLGAHKDGGFPGDYGGALPRHAHRLRREERGVSRRQTKRLCCLYALLHFAVWVHNQHLQTPSQWSFYLWLLCRAPLILPVPINQ